MSGTNGKTTTTRLLAAALGGPGARGDLGGGGEPPRRCGGCARVRSGGGRSRLEVDEAYLGSVARSVSAEVLVLLNLSRDQLDRVNEVRMLARALARRRYRRHALTSPLWPTQTTRSWSGRPERESRVQRMVRRRSSWPPACCGTRTRQGALRAVAGSPSTLSGVGRARADSPVRRHYARLTQAGLELNDGRVLPISLSMPARCNRANAAMAAVAARALGIDEADALESMRSVSEVEGRFSTVRYDGLSARLLLAKNPAGWAELLDLLGNSEIPVVIGINSRIADGHDPSWLWDVAFEKLTGRRVVATGERSRDLAVRLKYGGLEHQIVHDQTRALLAPEAAVVEYVGNYTAFQQLRRSLGRRRSLTLAPGRQPSSSSSPHHIYESRRVPTEIGAGSIVATDAPATVADLRSPGTKNGASESALRIAIVHPDLLGTYGDGGNGRVLACRAAWRGWPVELVLARSDKPLPTADIYCLGGGEDGPQVEAAALLPRASWRSSR